MWKNAAQKTRSPIAPKHAPIAANPNLPSGMKKEKAPSGAAATTVRFFDLNKASIGEAVNRETLLRIPESKRAEPFGPAHLRENAFEPVCPPSEQGNGLHYLTLS